MNDKSAWVRETVDAWEGRLVAYAARFLHGDLERARDVVQDTFLRLWEAERAEIDDHLARWLYTVCRNRAIDVQRKDGRMVTSHEHAMAGATSSDGRAAGSNRAATPTPDEAASAAETAGRGGLLAAVATLPPRQQEAVRLRFQGGLSYADMAGVMDTSVSNVGVLLHTAMRALRDRLDGAPAANTNTNAITGGAA